MVKVQFSPGEFLDIPEKYLRQALRELFPAGDPLFQDITWREQDLYNRKNADYAGGGEDPNGNFFRAGNIFALYPGLSLADPRVYAMSQMMKQIDQVLWSLSRGYEGSVEGLAARLGDVSVYAKIVQVIDQRMGEGEPDRNPDPSTLGELSQSQDQDIPRYKPTDHEQYRQDAAISMEDLLSRADAMLANLTKAVVILRSLEEEADRS